MQRLLAGDRTDPSRGKRIKLIREVLETLGETNPPEKGTDAKRLASMVQRALCCEPVQLEKAESLVAQLFAVLSEPDS